MMKRVRGTAKWSQLHKTGPSIPPKNKASFLNNDDDEEDDQMQTKDIDGTYRSDNGDDPNGVDMMNRSAEKKNGISPEIQVGLTATTETKSNIQVYQKMKQDLVESPDPNSAEYSIEALFRFSLMDFYFFIVPPMLYSAELGSGDSTRSCFIFW